MKAILYFILPIFVFCYSACVFAEDPAEIRSVQIIADSISALDKQTNQVWPNYAISESPTILTFNNGHVYALNFASNDIGWQKIQVGSHQILYSPIDKWGFTHTPMNVRFSIEGQSAFVFQLDMMDDDQLFFFVFVHERFHRYQDEHFRPMPSMSYKNNFDVENLSLMKLEENILADFIRAKGDSAKQLDLLKDFAAVNQVRLTFLYPASQIWEGHQQRMEGLADYVSLRLYQSYNVLGFSSELHLRSVLLEHEGDSVVSDRAVKWRHYGVGAALGYALDFLQVPHWKERVEKEGISQIQILQQSLNLSADEISKRLITVEAAYGYDSLFDQVSEKVTEYQASVHTILKDYERLEGVKVVLERPKRAGISGGGINQRMVFLEDGSTLSVGDSSLSSTTNNSWKLIFTDVPFLFQKKSGSREFKLEKDTVLILNNKEYKLKELIKQKVILLFDSITWKCKTSEFVAKELSGRVVIQDGKLSIQFSS